MSCSLSLGAAPLTKACATTTLRCPGRAREVGADAVHRGPDDGLVRPGEGLVGDRREGVPRQVGVQVGDAVDRDRAVVVGEEHRVGQPRGLGDDADAVVHDPGAEAEPCRGVVVARRQDDGRRLRQALERAGEQADGVDRRDRAVVDVTGDDDEVDGAVPHGVDEEVGEGRLVLEQVGSEQRAAEVPVAGVEDPHAVTVAAAGDIAGHPAASCGAGVSCTERVDLDEGAVPHG